MAIRGHWLVCLMGIVAISRWPPSTSLAQRNEASEMPEDCDQAQQYFNQMESKCRNCSEVMRLFEAGPNQDWQSANIDAVTFNTPASLERPPLAGDRDQDLRSRTEIISSVIGPRLMPLPPTGNSSPTHRRHSALKPSDALLSRLVMDPQPSSPDPSPALQDNDDDEAGQTDPLVGPQEVNPGGSNLRQVDESFSQLRNEQSTGLLRTAKRWQTLLFGFLQSNEVAQSGLLDAIERCRSSQNMSACQMWSNMCVLTMYSHSDSSPSTSPFSKRPASSSRFSRRPTTTGRIREDKLWPHPTRFKTSWQQCPKFSLTSICNSLRDWHRLERQHSLSELGDIYADDQAEGPRPSSIQSSPLKLNQQIQLLAYEYAFDGRLLKVGQYNLHDLGELCLFAPSGALPAHLGGGLSSSENPLQQDDPTTMKNVRDVLESERHIRVGQNMALSCRFSEFQANLLAPTHLNQTKFIDLFVGYQANGAAFVKPVPILLKNLQYQGQLVNLKYAKDSSRWRFVHRFFPFATLKLARSFEAEEDQDEAARRYRVPNDGRDDNDGALPLGRNNEQDTNQDHELLLFARSANLELKFKKQQDKGLVISSMLLVIDYDHLELDRRSRKSANNSTFTKPSRDGGAHPEVFESHIRLSQTLVDMHAYAKDLDLFVTILCIASSIWCLIKCYNIQKYHGLIKLDIHALLLFAIIACDVMANLLGLVFFAMALFLFASLKWQLFGLHQLVLAPNENLEQSLLLKLKLALSLKIAGFLYKLALRFRVDLFFIDWEKPKMLTSSQIMSHQQQRALLANSATKRDDTKSPHPMSNLLHNQQQAQQQISFWRPYTIVNRWLQMQTLRRQNLAVQLVAFLCSMQLTNLHRWATADPTLERDHSLESANSNPLEPRLLPNQSATFRALILALVYLALAMLQVVYKKFFYEPMIKCSVREFIDLCSVANVSLFSMLHPRFGFYVHGRNPNGSGDCGITEMNVLLEREARDLCSKRGLLPNSDQQTFVLVLPKIINDHYRKLLFRTDYAQMGATSPVFSTDKFHLQHQQPAEFIKSALSLSGSLAPAAGASSSQGQSLSAGSKRVLIENVVARNRAINSFLINFLEHAYREIDYSVRERRRFEGLLIEFDPNDEDDDSVQHPTKLPPARGARDLTSPMTVLSHRTGGISEATDDAQPAATFFTDTQNSFASLLWLGLEWDLILVELLLLLNLDLWLGRESLILTSCLVWLINKLLKSVYRILARKNLITKSMLDEKLLIR